MRLLVMLVLLADPAADFDKGRAAAEKGDLRTAAALFEGVTRTFPTWGLAWLELAETLQKDGSNPALLEKAIRAATSLETTNPRAFRLAGQFREGRGETALAIEAYGRAFGLRPESVEGRDRLGLLLVREGRFQEAVAHLEAVVQARPDDRGVRVNLAEAYEKTGDLKKAEAQLRAVVEGAPTNALYRKRLAEFYERSGDEKRAEEEYRRADQKRQERKLRPLPASKN